MIEKKYFQKGFTLAEILVVLAIIGIITGVVIVNTRGGAGDLALERSAHQVAQDIRRQLGLALQGRTFANCPGGETLDGYAIHFENKTNFTINGGIDVDGTRNYLLYAECDDNFGYDEDDDADLELVPLERGVKIKVLHKDGCACPNDKLGIAFEPPDPVVHFKEGNPSFQIILQLENNPSKTKTITVNNAGVVTVQ